MIRREGGRSDGDIRLALAPVPTRRDYALIERTLVSPIGPATIIVELDLVPFASASGAPALSTGLSTGPESF